MKNNYVFLTKGEITFIDCRNGTIHLPEKDNRVDDISTLLKCDDLNIITVNPSLYRSLSETLLFEKNKWLCIANVRYSGQVKYSGFVHYSFIYRFANHRELSEGEIRIFKKTQSLCYVQHKYIQ